MKKLLASKKDKTSEAKTGDNASEKRNFLHNSKISTGKKLKNEKSKTGLDEEVSNFSQELEIDLKGLVPWFLDKLEEKKSLILHNCFNGESLQIFQFSDLPINQKFEIREEEKLYVTRITKNQVLIENEKSKETLSLRNLPTEPQWLPIFPNDIWIQIIRFLEFKGFYNS